MLGKNLREMGAMVALGINYATAYMIAFVWDWPTPDSELLIHILLIFIFSFLFGAIIVNMKKTFFYTFGAVAIGMASATAVISAPSLILTGNIELVDLDITLAVTSVSRIFLVGITFVIVAVIAGCFVGGAVSEREI